MTDLAVPAGNASDPGWFVIWTAARAEKKVQSRLAGMGLDVWLPSVTEKHRWSDRWREVVLPLFPGYLFSRGPESGLSQLLRTPGVLTVVKEGGRPAMLTDSFIASLRRALACTGLVAERVTERAEYRPGDEVVIQEGALAGLRGVVRERRNATQLVVWVTQIGLGVALTVDSLAVVSARRLSA